MKVVFQNVDAYIDTFEHPIQEALISIRTIIKEAIPEAEECISYNMPAYKQGGPVAYFAAFKNHLGFYPSSSPIKKFADQLTDYKTSKGAIQFPYTQPLPADLIQAIVLYRVEEIEVAIAKKKKTKSK
jgi:uncharacterized protein YdhG (YjbR/CyaY superfamily)